jgi:DNA modification methylase
VITLLQGDACQTLRTLPDQSVQCVVTSPPYWGLRKYSDDPREIGNEPTPAAYVAALLAVFTEVWRVLRNDGTLWLNLGDSYGRGDRVKWAGDATRGTNAHKVVTDAGGYGTPTAILPAKNLLGMPWRVAFALQDAGWILRSDIIWSKPNAMPESVTDRPTRAHEYMFLFAKQARYFYDAAAIAEPVKQSSIDRINQPTFDAQTGGPKDYGTTGVNTSRSMRKTLENFKKKQAGHGRRHEGFNERYDFNNPAPTRNKRTVWEIATRPYSAAHFATMPEALIEPCVLAGSRVGDTVLDPFGGSGTVAKVAERFQRSAILIELNQAYIDLQEQRTDKVQVEMFV